jgi:hypothetical protein
MNEHYANIDRQIKKYYEDKMNELALQSDVQERFKTFWVNTAEKNFVKIHAAFWDNQPEMQQLQYEMCKELGENEQEYYDEMNTWYKFY